MNVSSLKPSRLWFAAAVLFAISAAVLLFHRDILSGCLWLIVGALMVVFATAKSGDDDEGCDRPDHTSQQAP